MYRNKHIASMESPLNKPRTRKPKTAASPRNVIGPRVKELRATLGIRQEDLAKTMTAQGAAIDRIQLIRLESQQRYVSDQELIALANILKTTPNALLGFQAKKGS